MDDDLDPVLSTCPNCQRVRVQCYRRDEVLKHLDATVPIRATCEFCGSEWNLSPEERAEVASMVARE